MTPKRKQLQRWAHSLDFMTIEDCIQLVCYDSELKFSQKEVHQVFAMSKMSVINDCDARGPLEYQRMVFVEFLEFLARLAVMRFSGTELEDYTLK